MNWIEFFGYLKNTGHNLAQGWAWKGVVSFLLALFLSIHAKLLAAFAALVIFDLLSKWTALSRQYLKDNGQPQASYWQTIVAMRAARRAGYIKSNAMKTRFLSKMLAYITLVIGASIADYCMRELKQTEFIVVLTIGYLAVTEMMSIIENLEKSGVDEAHKLKNFIDQKRKDL